MIFEPRPASLRRVRYGYRPHGRCARRAAVHMVTAWQRQRPPQLSLPRIDLGLAIVLIVLLDRPPYDPAGLLGGYWWTIYGTVAAASVAWRRVRPAAVWVITTVVGVLLIGP